MSAIPKVFNAKIFVGDTTKGNQGFLTWRKCNGFDRWKRDVTKCYPQWIYADIYDHKTKDWVVQVSRKSLGV
jgi:hypothetical protein